jgi:hypothetical protein
VAAAAADRLAHGPALEAEPTAGAGGWEDVGLDEERAHQGRPEDHECEDEWAVHVVSIGTKKLSDKIES